jgi:uracil-DNA glycosylase
MNDMINKINDKWKPILRPIFADPRFEDIKNLLKSDVEICPTKDKVFDVFEMAPSEIKLIIVGQDPYPTNQLAQGIAFAVPPSINEKQWPGSLKVIIESLENTMYQSTPAELYGPDGSLKLWRDEGIFLINRYLTCLPGEPGSHEKLWDWFTEELISGIDKAMPAMTYYLLGAKAGELKKCITSTNNVFLDYHPSYVVRMRKKGKNIDMTGHWKEISEKTGVIFFLPF